MPITEVDQRGPPMEGDPLYSTKNKECKSKRPTMQVLLFEEVAVAIEARDLGTRPQPNYSLTRPLTMGSGSTPKLNH